MKIIKCEVVKYDESIKKPPFLTKHIAEVEIFETDFREDEGGHIRLRRLKLQCEELGLQMKNYTLSEKEKYKYEILVY